LAAEICARIEREEDVSSEEIESLRCDYVISFVESVFKLIAEEEKADEA